MRNMGIDACPCCGKPMLALSEIKEGKDKGMLTIVCQNIYCRRAFPLDIRFPCDPDDILKEWDAKVRTIKGSQIKAGE